MQYDYGDPARGHSYEYNNYYQSLLQMGYDVTLFDFMTEYQRLGKKLMNQKLFDLVREERPELTLFWLYTDQFEPETVAQLRKFTTTICFFHDDTWRIEFSCFWARHFDYFTTPDCYGQRKYTAIGLPNAIHFPFGCNDKIYYKMDVKKKYDVSFVGGWHPYRKWLIDHLRCAGVSVEVAGYGWPRGVLAHEEMVKLISESRINLNLSNSASWDMRYLFSSWRAMANRIHSKKNVEQLKARHFEINGCGGFQLSFYVDGLEKYYEIGREIAIYTDPANLIAQVENYLNDEPERESIAKAGHLRTLKEHTFKKRFEFLFNHIELLPQLSPSN